MKINNWHANKSALQIITAVKSIILIAALVCFTALANGQIHKSFPYKVLKADIPNGFFAAGPFTKEEKAISLSANQGLVTDNNLISNMYEH